MFWAMRTSRETDDCRKLLTDELLSGRLRQGWGSLDEQDLRRIHEAWQDGIELTQHQKDASRHWRMADGDAGEYMNVNDVVLVPNMPEDGVFTLCRICGGYEYQQNSSWNDFRHVRAVEVLTPGGVANEHELVVAGLRRSLRCQGRLWRIASYAGCIEKILTSGLAPEDLRRGSTPAGRAESIVADAIVEPINIMAQSLAASLRACRRSCRAPNGRRVSHQLWRHCLLRPYITPAVPKNAALTLKSSFRTHSRKVVIGSFLCRSRIIRT